MRAAARRDSNEKHIVAALQAVGATIARLSATDLPDLLVGFRGQNWLMEVKTARGRYRPGQIVWGMAWRGQVCTVRTVEEALAILGIPAA